MKGASSAALRPNKPGRGIPEFPPGFAAAGFLLSYPA